MFYLFYIIKVYYEFYCAIFGFIFRKTMIKRRFDSTKLEYLEIICCK